MGLSIFAALAALLLLAMGALFVGVMRRAASAREELADQASTRGWRYVRSRDARKGDFHIEGTSRAGSDWTITCYSISSDSHRERIEFRMPASLAATADFAIGPAKEVAMLPKLAEFAEQHALAGSLIHMLGVKVGGALALVSDGVAEPLGSTEFQLAFGAVRSREAAMPVRMTAELERLFLTWPESLVDPCDKVTAWRDAGGLHVSVVSPAGPPWEIIEQLAELGETLGASLV
jgi:hypothetical protein